ncbi:MAG TPA: hypothetical protein VKR60_05435 [Candidatus Sulfotelmatobacter sp.]|nr:hypothetical protein [Candidatus Sulfotelmatobacter sp.]
MRPCAFLLLAALLTPQPATEVEITAEPHHHLAFENAFLRVFKVDIPPHTDTLMHWHRHDYIFVQLGTSEVVNAVQGRAPVTVKLQDGETRFVPGPFAHIARNISDQPFRNLTIEILEDAKLRESTAHWPEDRGLEILHGGTMQILFVKDGIRVTEFELQPGGVVPMHHHTGPHLLAAVSDLDLGEKYLNGVHRVGVGHLESGDVTWLAANHSHTLTNVGPHAAKFVTLEFP